MHSKHTIIIIISISIIIIPLTVLVVGGEYETTTHISSDSQVCCVLLGSESASSVQVWYPYSKMDNIWRKPLFGG
ncbi:hypothetical protein DPMN_048589 [Dreissena polymorpha]|uniref:Uncharacterized protein n=1 Tax=Dreissena polymorpha TaxID=45954 RepID=A0A9D4DBW3_DREPO|nr:hypothetical protein DPMN_048589 [Dreissena polymorpha]